MALEIFQFNEEDDDHDHDHDDVETHGKHFTSMKKSIFYSS